MWVTFSTQDGKLLQIRYRAKLYKHIKAISNCWNKLLWQIKTSWTQSRRTEWTWWPSFCYHVWSGNWHAISRVWRPVKFLFVGWLAGLKRKELPGPCWTSTHDLGLYNTVVQPIELTQPYAHLYIWQEKHHHEVPLFLCNHGE